MATIGVKISHVVCLHVILTSQLTSSAPGRPKAPGGRPRWNSEETGDISSGLLPYLIVFVIFPISLMLFCICANYAIKWCSRQLATRHHGALAVPASVPEPEAGHDYHDISGFLNHCSRLGIVGRRHSYTDLRSLSGFFSFRPATTTPTPTREMDRPLSLCNGIVHGSLPRDPSLDDPPPCYPVEEPPPTYESLFDEGKRSQGLRQGY